MQSEIHDGCCFQGGKKTKDGEVSCITRESNTDLFDASSATWAVRDL